MYLVLSILIVYRLVTNSSILIHSIKWNVELFVLTSVMIQVQWPFKGRIIKTKDLEKERKQWERSKKDLPIVMLKVYSPSLDMTPHTCALSLVGIEYIRQPTKDILLIRYTVLVIDRALNHIWHSITSSKNDALSLFWSLWGMISLNFRNLTKKFQMQ